MKNKYSLKSMDLNCSLKRKLNFTFSQKGSSINSRYDKFYRFNNFSKGLRMMEKTVMMMMSLSFLVAVWIKS